MFLVLLATHFTLVLGNWKQGSLPGCEFRQTQTALSALFIQKEHNFSLAYPTPVLGKPWSIPMEFPLYQWSVVALSNVTGLPLIAAGRSVTLLCFYLTLPAVYILLGRLGLPPPRRLVVSGLLLTCPLYIFYSRSFLIESMALMFALWFFTAFIETMVARSGAWLLIANLAGIGAGLAKVTTFIVYLLPAATCGLVFLARAWPRRRPHVWQPAKATLAWGISSVVVPVLAAVWWVHYSDAIKAPHPGGGFLTSTTMQPFNFGWTWRVRFAPDTWRSLLSYWFSDIVNLRVFILTALSALLFGGRWRGYIAAGFAFFVLVQLIFPILYAWHDYYFYANTVLLLVAIGLALCAALESRLPRWAAWSVVALAFAIQLRTYQTGYYITQHVLSDGGSGLTAAIRDGTNDDDVVIIAGNDWDSQIPFYSQRRALMIRRNREHDIPYLDRAFADLADESVAALVLSGDQRNNRDVLDRAVRSFGIDPEPFIVHKQETLYVRRERRSEFARRLFNVSYHDVAFVRPADQLRSTEPQIVAPRDVARFFSVMSPAPTRVQVPFGLDSAYIDSRRAFIAHSLTRLWFSPARTTTHVFAEFGIAEDAYTRTGGRTDGVEFVILEKKSGAADHLLFKRFLDPVHRLGDRGAQRIDLTTSIAPESEIVFETQPGPAGDFSYDWAYWGKIRLR